MKEVIILLVAILASFMYVKSKLKKLLLLAKDGNPEAEPFIVFIIHTIFFFVGFEIIYSVGTWFIGWIINSSYSEKKKVLWFIILAIIVSAAVYFNSKPNEKSEPEEDV